MLQRNSSSPAQRESSQPPEGLKSKAELMQSAALDRRLSSNAVHVLAVMLFDLCVTSIGVCRAKQETIAQRMGASVETVKRAIRELKAAGYLTVEQRYRMSAVYLFVWHRPVKSDRSRTTDRSNLTGQAGQNRPGRPVKSDRPLRESLDLCPRDSEPGERDAPSALAPELEPSKGPSGKEASKRASSQRAHPLPPEWAPSASDEAYGQELGFSTEEIWGMAAAMRLWCEAEAHHPKTRKSNWSAAFKGWMRRDAGKRRGGWVRPHEKGYAELADEIRNGSGFDLDQWAGQ